MLANLHKGTVFVIAEENALLVLCFYSVWTILKGYLFAQAR